MTYTKSTARSRKLEAAKIPLRLVPVATDRETGAPSDKELLSRLHARILRNSELPNEVSKYVAHVISVASPTTLKFNDEGKPIGFCSHRDVIARMRLAGATLNLETGKWQRSR